MVYAKKYVSEFSGQITSEMIGERRETYVPESCTSLKCTSLNSFLLIYTSCITFIYLSMKRFGLIVLDLLLSPQTRKPSLTDAVDCELP